MRRRRQRILLLVFLSLDAVAAVWIGHAMLVAFRWTENMDGRVPRELMERGQLLTGIGQFARTVLSMNVHAGFQDWRDPVVVVGVSTLAWLLPVFLVELLVLLLLPRDRGVLARRPDVHP